MAGFEEDKHPRDDHGRFSEGEGGERLPQKTKSGSLKGWARSGTTAAIKGGKSRWQAARERFGPLAGKLNKARLNAVKQGELFPQGEASLKEGTHFLKRSQGDFFGKESGKPSDPDVAADLKHANELTDQSFKDLAQKFPGVADYLKNHPLTEVQARAGAAEWGTIGNRITGAREPAFQFLPIAGQYTSRTASQEDRDAALSKPEAVQAKYLPEVFQHGAKSGDLILVPGKTMRTGVYRKGEDTPKRLLAGKEAVHYGDPLLKTKGAPSHQRLHPPWGMSAAAKDEQEASLVTILHEVGHHVALGDVEKATVREKSRSASGPNEDVRASVVLGDEGMMAAPDKHDRARALIAKGYDMDRSRSEDRGKGEVPPFTGYAASSPQEWFAEAFAAFHVRPDYLKEASPIAYKTVKKVMKIKGIAQPDAVKLGAPPLLSWAGARRKGQREL